MRQRSHSDFCICSKVHEVFEKIGEQNNLLRPVEHVSYGPACIDTTATVIKNKSETVVACLRKHVHGDNGLLAYQKYEKSC